MRRMEPDDKFLALASDVLQCTFRNDSVISSTLWPANLRVLESLRCSLLLPPVAIRKWEFILLKIYVAKLSVPIIILDCSLCLFATSLLAYYYCSASRYTEFLADNGHVFVIQYRELESRKTNKGRRTKRRRARP